MNKLTSGESQYISEQVQRTFKVMTVMAGCEIQGVSPSELAKLANTSPANITRALANLQQANFAERLPNDPSRWRLAPSLVQIANTVSLNINQAQQQLQQDQHNYSRLAI